MESFERNKNCEDELKIGDEEDMLYSLFADPDPEETFQLTFSLPSSSDNDVIAIELVGEKQENGQLLSSTGLTVWKASRLLCEYLISTTQQTRKLSSFQQNNEHFRPFRSDSTAAAAAAARTTNLRMMLEGERVLELGAGLGLCGILAHKMGASCVCITDGDVDVMEKLRENVIRNDCDIHSVTCVQLIWGEELPRLPYDKFDTILGADIVYIEEALAMLWKTVDALLAIDGKFVLSFVPRNVPIIRVFEHARHYTFRWHNPTHSSGIDGTIWIFSRETLR
jgi:predicted nicotinamide N-methyase